MSPAAVVLLLCLLAGVLAVVHRLVCEQDESTTSKCDIGFGVPVVALLAVACGISGLAVLAASNDK